MGGDVVGCCKLLGVGILCSCSYSPRSGYNVPVNLQQDKCYSLFCSFLSLYEWKSAIPLKVRALRMGCPAYFRLYSFEARAMEYKVQVKEIDLIWSQICSFLLQ